MEQIYSASSYGTLNGSYRPISVITLLCVNVVSSTILLYIFELIRHSAKPTAPDFEHSSILGATDEIKTTYSSPP